MPGRPKSEQGAGRRSERTVIRWTEEELKDIREMREALNLKYEVDLVRTLTLRGVRAFMADQEKNVAE